MIADTDDSIIIVSDTALDSLYFLGLATLQPDKSVNEIYAESLGSISGFHPAIMNVGTAMLGAYALFVLPRVGSFDEFSIALTGQNKLDWKGFTWTDSRFAPYSAVTNPNGERNDHLVLSGIRNGLTHANFRIELPDDEPNKTIIHLWAQANASSNPVRNVSVSSSDLASFAIRFHNLFKQWRDNGKSFL